MFTKKRNWVRTSYTCQSLKKQDFFTNENGYLYILALDEKIINQSLNPLLHTGFLLVILVRIADYWVFENTINCLKGSLKILKKIFIEDISSQAKEKPGSSGINIFFSSGINLYVRQ